MNAQLQSTSRLVQHTRIDFQSRRIGRFKQTEEHEAELVRAFFGNKTGGFFVDIGANEPFRNSQSYHLEQLGWRGVLVEPLPEMADCLREKRSSSVVQSAISSRTNHGKRLPFKRAGVGSSLQTCATDSIPRTEPADSIMVSCRTLESVLEEFEAPSGFDFLSIDVEGHESEVLESFDIGHWKPALILIEDHLINLRHHVWFAERGYKLILRTGINSWYVPGETPFSASIFAKYQMYKKLFIGLPFRKLKNYQKKPNHNI